MVAFISCNKVTAIPTFKISDIAGGWVGSEVAFVIYNNGNLTYNSIKYKIPAADWNSEKTEYTISGDDVDIGLTGRSITFKSASTGTATSSAGTTEINKVQ